MVSGFCTGDLTIVCGRSFLLLLDSPIASEEDVNSLLELIFSVCMTIVFGFLTSVNTDRRATDGDDAPEEDFKEHVDFPTESVGFLKISCPFDDTVTITFNDLSCELLCFPLLKADEYIIVELVTTVPDGDTVLSTSFLPLLSLYLCKCIRFPAEDKSTEDLASLLDDSSCSFLVKRPRTLAFFNDDAAPPTPFAVSCDFTFDFAVEENDLSSSLRRVEYS